MSELLTVRYPSGETEFRMRDKEPHVGDVLTRNGGKWIVEDVTQAGNRTTLVTLRPGHGDEPE